MGAEGEATGAASRPGNRDDFDRLYRENYPRLLRTLYAITGDAAAAEDCVQEAFVKAWRAWPRFRPERAPEGWLHQIAVNTAISYRRRAKLRSVGEILRRLGRPAFIFHVSEVESVMPDRELPEHIRRQLSAGLDGGAPLVAPLPSQARFATLRGSMPAPRWRLRGLTVAVAAAGIVIVALAGPPQPRQWLVQSVGEC